MPTGVTSFLTVNSRITCFLRLTYQLAAGSKQRSEYCLQRHGFHATLRWAHLMMLSQRSWQVNVCFGWLMCTARCMCRGTAAGIDRCSLHLAYTKTPTVPNIQRYRARSGSWQTGVRETDAAHQPLAGA